MSEDARTLWVGNLHDDVTDELVYELFLQTGPIEKLIFPTEGEGAEKKHKGHAYVLFKHADSVKFSSQVLEGSKLFGKVLEMKARSMPITYRSTPAPPTNTGSNNNRFRYNDNSSLRGGFNRTNTWHGREDFAPRGRGGGGYRNKGGYNQNNYNQGNYNNYNNQMNTGYWMGGQQQQQQQNSQQQMMGGDSNPAYSTDMEAKRQRLLQQQNMILQGNQQGGQQQQQQQQQQGMMNMYNMQPQQQQQSWGVNNSYSTTTNTSYNTGGTTNWSGMGNNNMYQAYTDQYSNYYSQQQ